MKKRYRQHINPLAMSSLAPRQPLQLGEADRVVVELGCADARFLIELARHRAPPNTLHLGLDIRLAFIEEGLAAAAELGNVRLETCNLIVDTPHLFAPGRVAEFYINFPDPWFKRRQQNRRWLTSETLDHLVRALRPGGRIFFQSDVWTVALEALGLFERHDALHNDCGAWTWLRENPYPARSTRELLCLRDGLPIWRLLFVRR